MPGRQRLGFDSGLRRNHLESQRGGVLPHSLVQRQDPQIRIDVADHQRGGEMDRIERTDRLTRKRAAGELHDARRDGVDRPVVGPAGKERARAALRQGKSGRSRRRDEARDLLRSESGRKKRCSLHSVEPGAPNYPALHPAASRRRHLSLHRGSSVAANVIHQGRDLFVRQETG